jgi:hypothetical protein
LLGLRLRRISASQAEGRGFETRLPLTDFQRQKPDISGFARFSGSTIDFVTVRQNVPMFSLSAVLLLYWATTNCGVRG